MSDERRSGDEPGEEGLSPEQRKYQPDRTSGRGLTIFAISLLGALGLVLVGIAIYFRVLGHRPRSAVELGEELPDGARQVTPWVRPGQAWDDYRRIETARLSTYRWVDRRRQLVAVPIDRAMELVARRGYRALVPRNLADQGAGGGAARDAGVERAGGAP